MNGWLEVLVTSAVLGGWVFVSSVAFDATDRPAAGSAPIAVQAEAGPPPCAGGAPISPPKAGAAAATPRDPTAGCTVR